MDPIRLINVNNIRLINMIQSSYRWHGIGYTFICDNCGRGIMRGDIISYKFARVIYNYNCNICLVCDVSFIKIKNISRGDIVQSLIIMEAGVLPPDVLLNYLIPLLV
jgi:hypothetical protein